MNYFVRVIPPLKGNLVKVIKVSAVLFAAAFIVSGFFVANQAHAVTVNTVSFEQIGAGTAQTTTEQSFSGAESIKLFVADGAQDVAAVSIPVDVALDQVTSLSFWKKVTQFTNGWNPSVRLGIDLNDNGYSDQDFQWIFFNGVPENRASILEGDTFITCEAPTGLTSPDTGFAQVNVLGEYKCWGPDATGTTFGSHYGPLSDYASNSIDGIPTNAKVKLIKIYVGENPASWNNLTAFIDSLELNGNVIISAPVTIGTEKGFNTIQSAIDVISSSDTINVAAGTYDEQVVINKVLTLQGAGDTTIIKPSSAGKLTSFYTIGTQTDALWNGKKLASIISVINTNNVIIKDLKVDGENIANLPTGADYVVGVSYGETSGIVSNVIVVNMNKVLPEAVRTYGMWLDAVTTPVSVEVKNSNIDLYNKNGINARGAELTVNIHDNTVTGPTSAITQYTNGIGIVSGANGIIAKNVVTRIYTSGTEYTATGIFTYDTSGVTIEDNTISEAVTGIALSGTSITGGTGNSFVEGNTVFNCGVGVQLEAPNTANNIINYNTIYNNEEEALYINGPNGDGAVYSIGAGNEAHFNNIYANNFGVKNDNPALTFDATSNYWGTVSSTEIEAKINGNATYKPFCVTASCTSSVYNDTTIPAGDSPLAGVDIGIPDGATPTSTPSVTFLEEAVLTVPGDGGTSTVTLPVGVTVSKIEGGDLDVTALAATSTTLGSLAGLGAGAFVDGALEWGLPNVGLQFSSPITVNIFVGTTFNGQTLNVVRSTSSSSGWTDDGIVPPATCTVASGICTFAATKASYYAVTHTDPIIISSVGGAPTPASAPTPAAVPAVLGAATPAVPPVIPPAGQVLGVATFNFASDLQLGMEGETVTELQKRLTAEGVYSGPVTGYFGSLTLAGVRAYQAKYGISQTGIAGPLTRAQLNGSQVAGASTANVEAIKAQIQSLQAQLVTLLQQLMQMLQSQLR